MTGILVELDDALVRLLVRELPTATARCGPPQDAAAAPAPAVNLFLYDVREAGGGRSMQWVAATQGDGQGRSGPALRLAATYAVTAWAEGTRTEHALLSDVLRIFDAHRVLPVDVLEGALAQTASRFAVETVVAAAPAHEPEDPWRGVPPKLAVDLRVLVTLESTRSTARGPQVRAPVIRVAADDGDRDASAGVPP